GVIARGDLEHLEVGVGGALPGQVRARLSLSGRDRPSWQLRASADKIDTALLAGADEASENPLSLQLQADGVGGRATLQGRFEQGDLHATVRPSKLVLEDKVLAFEPLVLDIFDGTITARGRGDFSDPEHATFRYATNARGLRFG